MFELNLTLVIFVFSFLIFMYLLNQIMLKPVGRVLELRAAKIKSDLEAAKDAQLQAGQAVTHYQEHLHEVRSKAQNVINESLEQSNYHRDLDLSRLREEGRKKVEESKAAIDREKSQLIEQLVEQETGLVNDIAEKLLGERVAINLEPSRVRSALGAVGVLEVVS